MYKSFYENTIRKFSQKDLYLQGKNIVLEYEDSLTKLKDQVLLQIKDKYQLKI